MTDPDRPHRVLALSMIFPPDGVSSAQLLGDICEDLHLDGVDVHVVTTQPHYNTDAQASAAQPIRWGRSRLTGQSDYRGVTVTHVRMNGKAASGIGRLAQWAWFHAAATIIGLQHGRNIDAVLCISPPPTVSIVGGLIARLARARLVFCVWEMYPEILVSLGNLKEGSLPHRFLLKIEQMTYEQADVVAPLTDAMRASIVRQYPDLEERTKTIPTFADTELVQPMDRQNSIRDTYGLADTFVVGYAGNLAVTQRIDTMLDAADHPSVDATIRFLVSGGGSMEDDVSRRAETAPNSNVVFTGHLPYLTVPELYAATDICVISLDAGISDSALPSKLYRIMAAGRPIMAIANSASSLAKFVQARGIGLVVESGDVDGFLAAIETLRNDPGLRSEMSAAGRDAAVREFSRPAVSQRYRDSLLKDMT